ncbi:SURF1 family protein [Roseibium aggregatum]|uniref:SURF1 family protein n=1 Tax=Roseibium aggregatum TaxID=187304 RepID=UPI001AD90A56|nr:SURF1 family protein [Roseibium aggregatum]
MTSKTAAGNSSPFRKLLWPFIAAVCALAVLLKLGFWQVDRLAWKEALIAKVAEDLQMDPVPAPGPDQWPAMDLDEADYRHVMTGGHFLDGAAQYYIALSQAKGKYSGPGYFIYSPFETGEGWLVMVNRGFIPQDLPPDIKKEVFTPPPGTVRIEGVLRRSEKPNWATPETDVKNRIWFARDTEDMASILGVPDEKLAPYSIDLDARYTPASGLPQAGETIVKFKNDHLGYALTWFGLAATLVGVFLTYAVSLLRRARAEKNGGA